MESRNVRIGNRARGAGFGAKMAICAERIVYGGEVVDHLYRRGGADLFALFTTDTAVFSNPSRDSPCVVA